MSNRNPNSMMKRSIRFFTSRWEGEDYPGAEPRFFLKHLVTDISVFILIPIATVFIYKSFDGKKKILPPPNGGKNRGAENRYEVSKSQIINFKATQSGLHAGTAGVPKRSPGTLVRVKLENVVETYSTAPVHAQIVDTGLGRSLLGGSLIGDATPDQTFDRITINFRFARDPAHDGVAFTIGARALELDGTLGLVALKKEGFATRSVLSSAASTSQSLQNQSASSDLKDILFRALTTGLFDEMGEGAKVAKNRSQVLSLSPGMEFFAELTDFFPGATK